MNTKINTAMRIVLGLALVVFGSNKFLHFMPTPPMDESVMNALGALMSLGFIMPTVAVIEIAAGLALLLNKATTLALIVLVPISYSIVAFHLSVDPAGIGAAALVAALNIGLLVSKRNTLLPALIKS